MIIDGQKIAEEIKREIKEKINKLAVKPQLAILAAEPNSASRRFIKLKEKFGREVGLPVQTFIFEKITKVDFKKRLNEAAQKFDGLIVQWPLPAGFQEALTDLPETKDVDGLGDSARQKLASGKSLILPGVAGVVDLLLRRFNIKLAGQEIALVGQGFLVGEPLRLWLLSQNIKPKVFDQGDNLKLLKTADIIISGAGEPHLIRPEFIKEGALLIDFGVSEVDGKIFGDFDPACLSKAALATRALGGVGPITVALIFANLLILSKHLTLGIL